MDWLRPSSAHRWLKCTGSILLEYQERLNPTLPPRQQSEVALRGSRLHEIAAKLLRNEDVDLDDLNDKDRDVVRGYNEYINSRVRDSNNQLQYSAFVEFIEYNVPILFFNGTVDYAAVKDHILYIVDLKTGEMPVEPEDNPQLYLYAYGMLTQVIENASASIDIVKCVIYQNGVKMVDVKPSRITDYIEFVVNYALRDVDAGNWTFRTGAHCLWCEYQALCPVKRADVYNVNSDELISTDVKIADGMLAHYKSLESAANLARDLIIHRYDKLTKKQKEELQHVLYQQNPKRSWTPDAMDRLLNMYPDEKDALAPRVLHTVSKIETILNKKGDELPSDITTEVPGNKILRRKL